MNDKDTVPGSAVNRWAGYLMITIAILHTVAFAPHRYWPDWLSGGLWDGDVPDKSITIFWALPGGFVPVVVLFGLLIIRLARRGEYIPAYVGWVLAAWSLSCTALIGPSGFISVLVPAALLIGGNLAARRTAARA